MARLWSSGFELNTLTSDVEWSAAVDTGAALAIQTTTVRSGTYALQCTGLDSGVLASVRFRYLESETTSKRFFRVYFRVATLPSAENTILAWNDSVTSSSTPSVRVTIDSTGALALYDEDGQIGSDSSALSTNTWYRLEFLIDTVPGAGSQEVRGLIDGVEFAGSATRNIVSTNLPIDFFVGGNLSAEAQTTGDWYFDDVAINDSTGSFQNSYPGEGEIIHLLPDGAGDAADWTGAYTDVDEVTPDNGTTVIESTTLDQVEEVTLAATPAALASDDTINCVQVGVRFGADGASEPTFVLRIKAASGGTVEESADITKTELTFYTHSETNPRLYRLTLYDLPGASTTPWTKADLDTAQIGARISVDATNNIEITTLWLLVDHKPAVAGGNLDTRNKRESAIGIDFPWMHVYPNPDGTIGQPDRQQSAYKYSAIAAAAPGGAGVKDLIQVGFIPFAR